MTSLANLVFWLSLAALAYTFVGYPAAIAAWARWRPRPVRPQPAWQPSVAIVVVMHDEAGRVDAKLRTCLAQDYPADRLQVCVVSDGSRDDTAARVRAWPDARVRVLERTERRGKADGLNLALESIDAEVVVFTDARQALSPQSVRCLVETLSDPSVAVVSGELVFRSEGVRDFAQGVDAYWRYEKAIRKAEARVHSVPGATGALYAMRRSAFRPIDPRTILDDVAIPMQACMAGGRVVFDGRAEAWDEPSRDPAIERRRKVRTLAGNFQLLTLMPRLLLPWHNPILLQFVSHKLLRLTAPWAMLALLLADVVMAAAGSMTHAVTLTCQLAFYLTAALAALWPPLAARRWARVIQAFVALNGFAVLGLIAFLTQRQGHLWTPTRGGSAA